ncbi:MULTISPECIES: hypothetical protein [Bacillaceae]|uniref:hypothetical protein n=1 Tax=Bacillaceae TaxID=186817 RepID=UPI000364FD97|nr:MULTISPECIES: hypothetical protein [Bacillaceae]
MRYSQRRYETVLKENSHAGNPKPSFEEREKLIAEYRLNSMTRVEKITDESKKDLNHK